MNVISAIRLDALSKLDVAALPTEFRLFAFGDNPTSKGTFKLDADGARDILAAYDKQGVDLAIDYEHQSLLAAENGQPAPAAGWFKPEVRIDGVYATNVRWTERAAEMLRNREYRYFSPTFVTDKEKRITRLMPAALTNVPASQGQKPLVAAKDSGAGGGGGGIVVLAEWSTAFVDTLPDSSFLYVAPGGKKDGEGKTVPRSLRHFPVKGKDGKPDLPHVRNALARIPDSNVPADVKKRITAEAERMLGKKTQKAKENYMGIATLVGLKDDAGDDEVQSRIAALVDNERKLLEQTGKTSMGEAFAEFIAASAAVKERDELRARLSEWEQKAARDEQEAKESQIAALVAGAITDGRVAATNEELIAKLKKQGEDFGVESLKFAIGLIPKRPARVFQHGPVADPFKAQLAAIEGYKREHDGASTADAVMALTISHPALFATTGKE